MPFRASKILILAFALGLLVGYKKPEDQAGGLTGAAQMEFLDTAKELRCPTCQGLSVLESDAPFSEQIKSVVREQVAAGKKKDEILKYFTERYGPWILRSPPKEGFNLVAWGLPIGLLVFGPVGVWFFVWRKRRDVPAGIGVRPTEKILAEMNALLDDTRRARTGGTP